MKIETPIGPLWLDADQKGLTAVSFERIFENEEANAQILSLAKQQLEEYFSGERHVFDVPLSFQRGTAFQQKVWRVLTRIPYGQSRTYKQVAQAIGQPKADSCDWSSQSFESSTNRYSLSPSDWTKWTIDWVYGES